jgi:tetratricopeptide (TPR) repeat protein
MRVLHRIIVFSTFVLISACAGVGIVATSDPLVKLNDAEDLFMSQDRPLPAERLIREAIAIYQQRNDPHGLGNSHREYGDLLRSPAVAKWEKVYRRDGFQDKSITFDNRLAKASEFYRQALAYYQRAAEQHREAGRYDALTNVYYNMAWSSYRLDERDNACRYYDQTIEAYKEGIRRNPSAKPHLPPGAGSMTDAISSAKRRAGC